MLNVNVRNIPIEKIKPYENNPRRVPDIALKSLVKSILEFGFKVPLVLDENNVIVTGHTRLLAARELGMTEIPCIVADDLTPEQIKAFRLADNKTSELTGWDFEKLDIEIEELAMLDVDMSDFGFQLGEVVQDDMKENKEIDTEGFAGEKFKHECPRCGFKF